MRNIEESLQILDKMPAFQKKFEIFKQGIISAAQAGLTYRGNPVQMKGDSQKNKKCFLGCIVDGKKTTLITDMPKQMFDAGYRFDQFGSLFITPFATSVGNAGFFNFKGTIISALKHQLPDEIYDHDTDGVLLALIGRFIDPSANKSESLKASGKVNKLELSNSFVIKQTASESVADSHHEYAARSEQIEKRKAEFQQKRLNGQQTKNIKI